MEQFNTLKRRSTDLMQQVQQNLPNMPNAPNMPNMPKRMPTLKDIQKNLPKNLPSMPEMPFGKPATAKKDEVQATWQRLDIPLLPRSSHSLNVVSGCAYVFGGEVDPRQPVDNDMHVIRLPFSSGSADYYKVKPKAAVTDPAMATQQTSSSGPGAEDPNLQGSSSLDEVSLQESSKGKGKEIAADDKSGLGDVPSPRVGHATAVIGSRIFMFGGRGGPEMKPLEEAGRVWVYDTRTNAWSYLDPAPAVKGGAIVPQPAPRSYHCATATDRPRDFPRPAEPKKKAQTWRQWAIGDTSRTGIPQDPVVGYVAEQAVDQESEGYGTFFVHAGCLANGDRTSDLWAFDIRARTWTELPAAPGPSRGGTAICISKSRLFRFGGYDGTGEIGGQLDFLHLEVETFDDGVSKGEISIHARAGWQTILQNNIDASSSEIPAEPIQEWPAARSVASLEAINMGGGSEYLVLCMGEHGPSSEGHAGAGTFFDDVWTFQVPPQGMSAASLTAAVFQAVGRKTGEGKWTRLTTGPYDDEVDDRVPTARGWLASAPLTDLEESGIIIFGGLGEDNKRIGDGWILRMGE